MKLLVSDVQRFCMHDGPGLRTVVFLKGCPLRCAWCHNPETQHTVPEMLFYRKKCIGCGLCAPVCPTGARRPGDEETPIDRVRCTACGACARVCPSGAMETCGMLWDTEKLTREILRNRAFFGAQGGVTLSGGEPMMQPEGAMALLRACKEAGVNTAVETCGWFDERYLPELVPLVDLFLWDVKDMDGERHRRYNGVGNEKILQHLRQAAALGAKTRLRCILVNGVNAEAAHYENIAALCRTLPGCQGAEWIPYHAYGGVKASFLGGKDNGNAAWIPAEEQLACAREALGAWKTSPAADG